MIDRHLQYGLDWFAVVECGESDIPEEALPCEISGSIDAIALDGYGLAKSRVIDDHLPASTRLDLHMKMGAGLIRVESNSGD